MKLVLTTKLSRYKDWYETTNFDAERITHVVYGMGQELLFWNLKNLNKLLVFEALYP